MNKENRKIFNDFIQYETFKGHSIQGLRRFKTRVPYYLRYLEEIKLSYYEVGINEAMDFQKYLIEKGLKNNSVLSHIGVVITFYKYLKKKKLVLSNPFSEIKKVKRDFKIPRNVLKEKEMILLLNELSRYDECPGNLVCKMTAYKVHIISELMYSTGMRSSEAAKLRVEDIDFEKGIVNILEGKGGYSRIAFLNDYAGRILKIYVDDMRDLIFNQWNKDNGNLFGMGWERLNKAVNLTLKRACKKLKIKKITSHIFRHAVGYHFLRSGCDIRYIQNLLGHKKLKTTEVYTKVDKKNLKEIFNKYHPRVFARGRLKKIYEGRK